MLEYYNGILFLTTNRAGVLDEAVKSRVHLNLRYDHLNEDQTVEIFRNNIELLREIEAQRGKDADHEQLFIVDEDILRFAREHYRRGIKAKGVGRWNGRQIRNAFLIAASMVHYEAEGSRVPGMQKQLRGSHFTDVEATTLLYDQFRESTLGGNDSEVAWTRVERDDFFSPQGGDRRNSAYDKNQFQNSGSMQLPYQPPDPRGQRGVSSVPMEPPNSMPAGDPMLRSSSQQQRYGPSNTLDGRPQGNPGQSYENANNMNPPPPGGYGQYNGPPQGSNWGSGY